MSETKNFSHYVINKNKERVLNAFLFVFPKTIWRPPFCCRRRLVAHTVPRAGYDIATALASCA